MDSCVSLQRLVRKKISFKKNSGKKFIDLLDKIGIPLPSKDEALSILAKYAPTDEDLKESYDYLPKIFDFFKSKKSFDVSGDIVIYPKRLLKSIAILASIVAISRGIVPNTYNEAKAVIRNLPVDQYINLERERCNCEYLGVLDVSGLDKVLDGETNMYLVQKKIMEELLKKNSRLKYKGYLPGDTHYKIYKDKNWKNRVISVNDLLKSRGVVYLRY